MLELEMKETVAKVEILAIARKISIVGPQNDREFLACLCQVCYEHSVAWIIITLGEAERAHILSQTISRFRMFMMSLDTPKEEIDELVKGINFIGIIETMLVELPVDTIKKTLNQAKRDITEQGSTHATDRYN